MQGNLFLLEKLFFVLLVFFRQLKWLFQLGMEITNYTLSQSNAFFVCQVWVWLLRISSPGAQLSLGELKKKISEIPEYKFLNIKVLGNSNKIPTLLSLSYSWSITWESILASFNMSELLIKTTTTRKQQQNEIGK